MQQIKTAIGSDGGQDHIQQTYKASSIDRIVAYLLGGDDQYNGGSDGGSDGDDIDKDDADDDDLKGDKGDRVIDLKELLSL